MGKRLYVIIVIACSTLLNFYGFAFMRYYKRFDHYLAVALSTNGFQNYFQHESCIAFYCGKCCVDNAVNRSGHDNLQRFYNHIVAREEISVGVLGNSVSLSNNYQASRTLVEFLSKQTNRRFVLKTRLDIAQYGGFQLTHMERCGMNTLEFIEKDEIDIVVLQWLTYAYNSKELEIMELVLRHILSMDHKPIVLLVSHCWIADFAEWDVFQFVNKTVHRSTTTYDRNTYMWDFLNKSQQHEWEYVRDKEREFAQYYSLPYVDTCGALAYHLKSIYGSTVRTQTSAFHTVQEECEQSHFVSVDDLVQFIFDLNGGDPLHYSVNGNIAQGCLMGHAMLPLAAQVDDYNAQTEIRNKRTTFSLPPIKYSTVEKLNSLFCAEMKDETENGLVSMIESKSSKWIEQVGGRNQRKKWLEVVDVYETITFRTPKASQLTLSYYTHHDLPMGAIMVEVDGDVTMDYIDGCCQNDCVPGAPGQGIYTSTTIASNLSMQQHIVRITSLPKNSTICTAFGSKFDIVALSGSM